MKSTQAFNKKATENTADGEHIKHIASLVHEMRTKGCQVVNIVGQAKADPSGSLTEAEREGRRLIAQLGGVLVALVEAQLAIEGGTVLEEADDKETNGGTSSNWSARGTAVPRGPTYGGSSDR
jgi:hypothetical protein